MSIATIMGLSDVPDFCCNGTIEKFDKFVTQRNQVENVQLPKSQTCFKKKRSMKRIPRTLRGVPMLLDLLTGGSSCTNQSSPFRAPSGLVCRQFWKAGHHSFARASKPTTQNKGNYLHVHPEFLHSNATSHKWVFGAIAELLDNAVDEIENGATYVNVDRRTDPRDRSRALLIQDDGGGMDQDAMRRCMSFGFSDKKLKLAVGQYGNGFKTSSMRLGADVIVFS